MSSIITTNFNLSVPHHTYLVTDEETYDFDNHLHIYMDKYINDITFNEKINLLTHKKYVRIMCFKDNIDKSPYIKCYCRDISEMIDSHLEEATEYFKCANTHYKNIPLILVEINYVTRGFFHLYRLDM